MSFLQLVQRSFPALWPLCPRRPSLSCRTARRPRQAYAPLDSALLDFQPKSSVQLSAASILSNLPGTERRRSWPFRVRPPPSLRPVCPQAERRRSGWAAWLLLQKPNGRVRGIVVGDFLRRLTLAQSFAPKFLDACQPFRFALATRAGTEAVAHALATDLHPDGVGAFDTISRQAMLQALRDTPGANGCLPFARQFYANPCQFVWHDARGNAHVIHQAEGGEQGDPLMPALFALGQHAAL